MDTAYLRKYGIFLFLLLRKFFPSTRGMIKYFDMTFRLMLTLSWPGGHKCPHSPAFFVSLLKRDLQHSCARSTYESVDAKSLSSAVAIEIGSYGVNIQNTTILEPFFSRFLRWSCIMLNNGHGPPCSQWASGGLLVLFPTGTWQILLSSHKPYVRCPLLTTGEPLDSRPQRAALIGTD